MKRRINPLSQFRRFGVPQFRRRQGDADRARILEGAYRIREGLDPKPKTLGSGGGFAGVILAIPELDFPFVQAMFPELKSRDATERSKGWERFHKSPLSEPYRLTKRIRRA